jgi:hypothetical protein
MTLTPGARSIVLCALVTAAEARELPVFVETRILYNHLTSERFEGEDANIYTGTPPLSGSGRLVPRVHWTRP